MSENSIVPVVAVNTKLVIGLPLDPTAPLKVVPPELVMVRVPTPDTDVPVISAPATPPVAKVKLKPAPVTAPIVKSATSVAAFVLRLLAAPKVMAPKVIGALVLLIVPLIVLELGAVAVKPPVKTKVPLLAPKAKVPLLLKVTASVIVPELAFSAKL